MDSVASLDNVHGLSGLGPAREVKQTGQGPWTLSAVHGHCPHGGEACDLKLEIPGSPPTTRIKFL